MALRITQSCCHNQIDHAANVAWSFLSRGIDVSHPYGRLVGYSMSPQVLRKKDFDKKVVDLYSAMFSAHISASRDSVLEEHRKPRPFYEALFKQTIECSLFIEGYAKNSPEGTYTQLRSGHLIECSFRTSLELSPYG